LRSAIRDPDPVVVLEPRSLYAERGEIELGEEGLIRLGRARSLMNGGSVTVVALGQMVGRAVKAVKTGGFDAEVIDLLTLVPWDREAVTESVRRTGRLAVVEDSPQSGGWGNEIVSHVASHALSSLLAPPIRICAPDVPVPYPKSLESRYAPTAGYVGEQLSAYLDTNLAPEHWWVKEAVAL
jgi:pyruvate dehydrogenase E1 component beta subunit